MSLLEVLDLRFGVLLRDPLLLLDLANENVAFTGDLLELVIGQFPPFLFTLPLNCFQLSCT